MLEMSLNLFHLTGLIEQLEKLLSRKGVLKDRSDGDYAETYLRGSYR
jgi:hypothetical protein